MESSFQFTTPSLVGLEYEMYEGFSNENNAEININMELSVSVERIKEEDKAKVSLTLILGRKNTEVPFYIKAIETAMFKWDSAIDEELLKRLLNQNAPSLLLSYLRPVITQITAASPYEAYNIPFINFTSMNSSE